MISFTDALMQLHLKANPKKAAELKNSLKISRTYLGISSPELDIRSIISLFYRTQYLIYVFQS